jgi:Cas6b C-terminal domain/Cas6b N-terminal domain
VLQTSSRLVEFTVARYTVKQPLDPCHARWLRGALASQVGRSEFHNHTGHKLVYQHPLIRYDVCKNQALVLGMAHGAFLLRNLPAFDSLRLGPATHQVLKARIEASRVEIGPSDEPIIYRFDSPFLALNQQNHQTWMQSDTFARRRLLERIVIGNLLSLSKAIGLDVAEKLHADVDLSPEGWQELKPGVELLGFRGVIQVNFRLPDGWGIGKSSARGFGTLRREGI